MAFASPFMNAASNMGMHGVGRVEGVVYFFFSSPACSRRLLPSLGFDLFGNLASFDESEAFWNSTIS